MSDLLITFLYRQNLISTKAAVFLSKETALFKKELVYFGAKRMSRSDNFPLAFLRILTECFSLIGNSKDFLLN